MRICLTGADGALGRIVQATLRRQGDQVVGLAGSAQGVAADNDLVLAGDLADPAAATAAVAIAADRLGRFDALIHLAGAFRWLPVEPSSVADWNALYLANVGTAVATIQAALPYLEPQSSIVLVGAQSAQPAAAGMAPYGAAKSGVARLTEALSAELRPRRIRVNAILPSIIDTPANRRDMPDAEFSDWTSPEAIADVLRFLSAPASRALNGALVPVTNAA